MDYLDPALLIFIVALILGLLLVRSPNAARYMGGGFPFLVAGVGFVIAGAAFIFAAAVFENLNSTIRHYRLIGALFGYVPGFLFLSFGLKRWFKYTVALDKGRYQPAKFDTTVSKDSDEPFTNWSMSVNARQPAYNSEDLNVPLSILRGFSKFAQTDAFGALNPRQFREYASLIRNSSARLLDVVDNMIEQGKLEAGQMRLRETNFDLGDMVHTCLRLAEPEIERKNISLVTSVTNELVLHGDEGLVQQMLLSLLSNAVKHTETGGVVTVALFTMPNGGHSFIVKDTGRGMTEREITSAMQPFSQLGLVQANRLDGAGLALALVKTFTDLHGGEMLIESKLNSGTSVCITFPPARTGENRLQATG